MTENRIPKAGVSAQQSSRYGFLDTCRGVACLLVVLYHSTEYYTVKTGVSGAKLSWENLSAFIVSLTRRGWIGVPVFFVISGYCIAASAESTWRAGSPPSRYFLKRLRRIYPPFWAFLTLAVLGMIVVEQHFGQGFVTGRTLAEPLSLRPLQWLGNVTLTESWRYLLGLPGRRYLFEHIWILCYEEQFYVIVGLIMIASYRRVFFLAAAIVAVVTVGGGAGGLFSRG